MVSTKRDASNNNVVSAYHLHDEAKRKRNVVEDRLPRKVVRGWASASAWSSWAGSEARR